MTRRAGGISAGPYASLNLGLEVGDDRTAVLENRERVRRVLGIAAEGPVRVSQVHGVRIVEPAETPCEADGIWIRAGDPWAAVSAADCAPVAIVSADGALGALVHSGWRGARDRIAARAAKLVAEGGAPIAGVRAAIGPCIHACCYPVGEEVVRDFPAELILPLEGGGRALDLPGAIAWGLREAGVPAEGIHAAPECTSCLDGDYYSHRRDRGVTGRHWALMRLSAPMNR